MLSFVCTMRHTRGINILLVFPLRDFWEQSEHKYGRAECLYCSLYDIKTTTFAICQEPLDITALPCEDNLYNVIHQLLTN